MTNNQVPPGSHPAREYMLALGRELPGFWRACDEVRKASSSPECYLADSDGGKAFVEATYASHGDTGVESLRKLNALDASRLVTPCTTLATWRMTQGIYRIDPAVYSALIETPITGEIPSDVLLRLPEWCIYVETPGLHIQRRDGGTTDLRGVFARIDVDENSQRNLVICLDVPAAKGLEAQALALVPGQSLHESVLGAMAEWYTPAAGAVESVTRYLTPIINLLLYICSTGDVSGKRGTPGNPAPVRTRRDGLRLFPADGPRTWDVGVRMGSALRAAYQAEQTGAAGGEHSGPRPHVRRAHWHGFRSGPRRRPDGTEIPTAARKFELRWLPPIPVNLDAGDADKMPSVIRPVKQISNP